MQRYNPVYRIYEFSHYIYGNSMCAEWGKITVRELQSAIGGNLVFGLKDMPVNGLSTDTRKIAKGEFFIALKGEHFDGHDFLQEAISAGAAGIIVENNRLESAAISAKTVTLITVSSTLNALGDLALWWRRQWGKELISITGSNGKSTTKEMTASILSKEVATIKTPGNFNNLIGLPLTILSLTSLHKTAVLEMGMNRPGEIRRLTQIANPDIGVITNISGAHLEGLGDLSGVIKAKAELLEGMREGAVAVLNGDDEATKKLIPAFQGSIIQFGLGRMNDVRAENIRSNGDTARVFDIVFEKQRIPVCINIPGAHNIMNALAAAAVGHCLSVSNESIINGLAEFKPLNGRFQVVSLNRGLKLIDDTYNANPSSLHAAIREIKVLKKAGLLVGLGEMMELGKEASLLHVNAGELVGGSGVKFFVAIGRHGEQLIEGALKGGLSKAQTCLVTNHDEMFHMIKTKVSNGDIIFLKGSRAMALDKVAQAIKDHFGLRTRG
jgi:UDP-N-acetylmuramoyl-tripeptide--D-alanyl-D-alanine ligase